MSWDLFQEKKQEGNIPKHLGHVLNTSHPKKNLHLWIPLTIIHDFYLSNNFHFLFLMRKMGKQAVQKKITALNSTKKFMTLILSSLPSTNNSQTLLKDVSKKKTPYWAFKWPMSYCNLKNWGKMFLLLKDKYLLL